MCISSCTIQSKRTIFWRSRIAASLIHYFCTCPCSKSNTISNLCCGWISPHKLHSTIQLSLNRNPCHIINRNRIRCNSNFICRIVSICVCSRVREKLIVISHTITQTAITKILRLIFITCLIVNDNRTITSICWH